MQETYTNNRSNNFDDEIDLRELFYVLLDGKWIIVSIIAFVSTIGVIFSLLLPDIYESKAKLVSVNLSGSSGGGLGGYSGLASLAGVNLPTIGVNDNSIKAMQKIGSLSFFENNILPNIYLPDLMAFKSWDSKANKAIYDESIYDTKNDAWIRDYSYPQQQIPSAQESFELFNTKHLFYSEDKKSGFITLSIKHQSPFIAKEWAELVIKEINAFYRQKDKLDSEKSVNYLNQQISITSLSEVKQAIAQLLQEETQRLTLIESNEYYVFEYVDPPAVMEKKLEPKRGLILIFSAILGAILSIIIVLMNHYVFKEKVT